MRIAARRGKQVAVVALARRLAGILFPPDRSPLRLATAAGLSPPAYDAPAPLNCAPSTQNAGEGESDAASRADPGEGSRAQL